MITQMRHQRKDGHAFAAFHLSPDLCAALERTQMPKLPACIDDGWFEAHWYAERARVCSGPLRHVFGIARVLWAAVRQPAHDRERNRLSRSATQTVNKPALAASARPVHR